MGVRPRAQVNQRDRAGAVTADQQKDNTSDRTITQNIRKSLMKDKGLSTYARNIKIISGAHGRRRHRFVW